MEIFLAPIDWISYLFCLIWGHNNIVVTVGGVDYVECSRCGYVSDGLLRHVESVRPLSQLEKERLCARVGHNKVVSTEFAYLHYECDRCGHIFDEVHPDDEKFQSFLVKENVDLDSLEHCDCDDDDDDDFGECIVDA